MSLSVFFSEFFRLLTPTTLFNSLWATAFGIIVGMLPGLQATMGVALITGSRSGSRRAGCGDTDIRVIGAIYGGSRSAILLNIPGTAANAATCLDGNPLARKGRQATP